VEAEGTERKQWKGRGGFGSRRGGRGGVLVWVGVGVEVGVGYVVGKAG